MDARVRRPSRPGCRRSREFGFTNPVLIDEEDGIIAGHGRVLAAHLLGLDEVPCIVLGHSRSLFTLRRSRPRTSRSSLALGAKAELVRSVVKGAPGARDATER